MMKLLSSPSSPFVRKVRIAAGMKGVLDRIEMQPTDTNKGGEDLYRQNPLGKIPCLITDGGMALYDSPVICEYLDTLAPEPVLFPKSGSERFGVLTQGALGDGILDAALLLVYENRFRPENMQVAGWIERQQSKIDRSLGQLEATSLTWSKSPDYGHLTLACALGYLDFRHEGEWRAKHPKLVAWLDRFAKAVPDFGKTMPVG
jgi:glutathione S-transferase